MKTGTKALLVAGGALLLTRWIARQRHWKSFHRRVVLITGGSRGLGLELAREFGQGGARVVICARDAEELDRAKADLDARGIETLAVPCDVTDAAQARLLAAGVLRRLGVIDVLVNNAGVIQVGPAGEMTREDYETAMNVHFWGALNVIDAVLPAMRERGGGRIVNIASIGGKLSVPHLLPYAASKFALVGFSEGLRADLAQEGILVTTVCPGLMRTGSPVNALFKGRHRLEYAWFGIGGALPGLSMSSRKAARRIAEACRKGQAHLVLTLPARLAELLHGVFPGATAELLSQANRLLPGEGGVGPGSRTGAESESFATRSVLTRLSRRAAAANNELASG